MAETQYMLTTTDNPFDPFSEFDEWFAFDTSHGYNTCSYLARQADMAPNLPDDVNEELVDQAMNEIVEFDLYGRYKKVSREKE